MIKLYTFPTPNGRKASIMLEEVGLAYDVYRLDLMGGEHLRSDYMAISPIGKLPALTDTDVSGPTPARIFGSGAILLYLAEKMNALMPAGGIERIETLNWLAFGVSDLGPNALDMFRFTVRAPEKLPYAIDLFKGEMMRCYNAMETQLHGAEFLGGPDYTIADIACYPFIAAAGQTSDQLFDRFPNMKRWHDEIASRPAVRRGMAIPD